jgi:uncharacterized protein YbjQ (UPF0145 family)
MEGKLTLSTLEHLPGMDIEEHMGLVSGSATISGSSKKSLKDRISGLFGGRAKDMDATFDEARNRAVQEMEKDAENLGANCVINIRFESLRLASGYCEVHVYGSAVKATSY